MRNASGSKRAQLVGFLEHQLQSRGWSKAELARQLNVDRTTVFRWLRGEIRSIQPDHIRRMADVFNVDHDELLALAGIRASNADDAAAPTLESMYPPELENDVERQLWDLDALDESERWNLIVFYRMQKRGPSAGRSTRRTG